MDTILQASLTGLLEVFAWPAFGLMLLAIVVGFFVGIIPFVSIPMTLALMLPFTFGMKPVEAFAFLLGMLSISIIFSDITSIIFGVPGEPVTAAIILDGHPMAKLGQTGRALGAAFMSSLIGSIIGAVVLAASVPVVRPIALSFGAPEFFGMALLGILFIAALSGGNTTKGVLMGLMGLMLSMVGMDPQSGTQRFTLGMIELYDGLGLIPVTVGLFGVAELVDLWLKQKSIAEVAVGRIGGVWQGCKDTFVHIGLTLRCSFLGAFLGIIPGLGGAIAQWLAYAHAVQSSKDKSQFGKGDVRGVIGPGATMNAKEGGNLITTVAFGVPSTVTMAILLGAFLIQGVVPGPDMLTKNLDLTMSFVWIVILSHVIGIGLCFLLINQMVKITEIRSSLLLPAILLLALLGGFADKSSLFDMLTAVGAGFVGLAMVRLDWPRPPLILGLVLGRIAENNFFIAYTRYGVSFVLRPVLIGIIVVGIVLLLAPTFQKMLGRRAGVRQELLLAEEG
ncbi:MAG TPA: tripartite tricarboxylate transporter permease [Chloroflexota bacterium]|nr:tripartite tricarboxylate transporter permease [Chloroflexota bacterium]